MTDMIRPVLALTPLLFFLLAWAVASSLTRDTLRWRVGLLYASLASGIVIAAGTELLSLAGAVSPAWLGALWLGASLAIGVYGARSGKLQSSLRALRSLRPGLRSIDLALVGGIALIVLSLFMVAVASPPNNVDSLLYHLARVAHWSQAGSLDHYATAYHHQLFMPPLAEMAILHLRQLAGGEALVGLVQWSAMAVSLVVVSAIAARLGAGAGGQILSAALALSVPMGILQATSTQNDYVVTLWICIAAYLAVRVQQQSPTPKQDLALGVAVGLGVLTKATAWPYLAPFVVWYVFRRFRLGGWRPGLTALAVMGAAVLLLNLGYWGRNLRTYGHPLGEREFVGGNLAIADWIGSLQDEQASGPLGWLRLPLDGLAWAGARVARSLSLNLVTPVGRINQAVRDGMVSLDGDGRWFGDSTLAALENAAWNHEDTAANPLHLALAGITLVGLYLTRGKSGSSGRVTYAAAAVGGFLLLQITLSGADAWFAVRFQLPFFVLFSALGGTVLSLLFGRRLVRALTAFSLLAALPCVLLNNTRPIVGMPPWPTRTESVFAASDEALMFAIVPQLRQPYRALAETIQQSGCKHVGLSIDSGDLEYLFWWVIEPERHGIEIQTIEPLPSLRAYLDPGFEPCAVICTHCGDRAELRGLPRAGDFGNAVLFQGPGETPGADG